VARVEASTHIESTTERVWEVLTDWEAQPVWMVDARSVEVMTAHREGPGVLLRCRTNIAGGVVVTDDMETTEWEEHRVVGVRHLGQIIRGAGAFELEPTDAGVHLIWWEEFDPPLGALGDAAATVAIVPYVRRIFRASLANLKRVCETQRAPRG
jgi:uncharacterized membrane protein